MADSVAKSRQAEEEYLAARASEWIEGLTKQRLASQDLAKLLRNGRLLKRVSLVIESGDTSGALSRAALTEERKGFQSMSDVNSFLECCRALGLPDHQLFNASDVTSAGGDLVSVCRTVRSLALRCEERGIEAPVFETEKQKERARRRGMSTSATSGMVTAVRKKLGLEGGEEEGTRSGGAVVVVACASLAAVAALFALSRRPRTYVVRKGDTLSRVVRRNRGVTLQGLAEKNNLENPNMILADQKLKL